MNLFDEPVETEHTFGANSAQKSLTLSKRRSPVLYNSDSSSTVTPVLDSSTETAPPIKPSTKTCSSLAMIADIQTINTDLSRTSPPSNDSDEVRITKVEKSPEKNNNVIRKKVRDGKKGREGASRVKVVSESSNTIRISDSVSSSPEKLLVLLVMMMTMMILWLEWRDMEPPLHRFVQQDSI